MIRFSVLAAAALLLPNFGAKPGAVAERSASVSTQTALGLPRLRFPKFLRIKRKHGAEVEIAQMKTRLRQLVVQQETWFAQNSTYGRNVDRVSAVTVADSTVNKVQVQILFASNKGWSAVASHPNAPGLSCVTFVGGRDAVPVVPRTRQDANEATMEGIPACDGK